MAKKRVFTFVGLAVAVTAAAVAASGYDWHRPHFPHTDLTITRSDGSVSSYDIEVAKGAQNQEYGLMFVRSMPANAGMIFPDDPPREVAFWMKNTLIPLDMLFVGADHRIGHIVANARPQDVTPIPSLMPVAAVIELNGGAAERDHLQVGDKVDSPALP